jgi:hypothetical protein
MRESETRLLDLGSLDYDQGRRVEVEMLESSWVSLESIGESRGIGMGMIRESRRQRRREFQVD